MNKLLREWAGENPDTIHTVGRILLQDAGIEKGLNKVVFAGIVLTEDKIEFTKEKRFSSIKDGKEYSQREMWECEIIIKPIHKYKPKKDGDTWAANCELGDAIVGDGFARYNWDKKEK